VINGVILVLPEKEADKFHLLIAGIQVLKIYS